MGSGRLDTVDSKVLIPRSKWKKHTINVITPMEEMGYGNNGWNDCIMDNKLIIKIKNQQVVENMIKIQIGGCRCDPWFFF